MTLGYDNTATALADAHRDALARAMWPDTGPPDPDAAVRESIAALAPVAPSAQTAAALLYVCGIRPVPLHRESLNATAEPLATLAEVDAHWRVNLADGVGVRAGAQLSGSTVFAVRGPVHALRGWLADAGTMPNDVVNERGVMVSSGRTYRPTSRFSRVSWSSPPARPRSIVTFGADILDGNRQLPGDKAEEQKALAADGWLVWCAAVAWSVPGERGRRLEVASRKLGKGVEVVGEGAVIPWHVRDRRGWTLSADNLPIDDGEPLSPWIVDAVRGSWKPVSA